MLSSPLVVRIPPSMQMTDDQFFELCQINSDLRIERNKFREISIMPPTGSETGNRDARIIQQLMNWADEDGTGIAFSSSTGFTLSTGAERCAKGDLPVSGSPDASWVKLERWNTLSPEQQQKFAPICPDFVVELRSPSDNLRPLQGKMAEYIRELGVQLGWLIDRKHSRVYIYRPGMTEECLENLNSISGAPVLPGFVLNLSKVW